MPEVRISDTLSGETRALEPRDPPSVGIYTCGPTVYSRIHVGNARPFVIPMLLRRLLRRLGYEPRLVINVTDINDKIYDAAREAGGPPRPPPSRGTCPAPTWRTRTASIGDGRTTSRSRRRRSPRSSG